LPREDDGRAVSARDGGAAAGVHLAAVERAFGRIFTVVIALYVAEFWFSSAALTGQRPASVTANLLLSLLMLGEAARAVRRRPSQRDLTLLAVAAGVLVPASWLLAVRGSPFLTDAAYLLAVPVAMAWAAMSRRLIVPVPVLLVVLATGVWNPGASFAVEESVTTLATVAFAGVAARLMLNGARHADAAAELLSRQMASQAAELATEEAERRAANAVHDDVLSVLRAVSVAGQPVPWTVLVAKARRALAALSRQVPADRPGSGGLAGALLREVRASAAGLDVSCDIEGGLDVPPQVTTALRAAAGEALRNVAAHAGVRSAEVTARDDGSGGVTVSVRDEGIGFDPARVGPASTGVRSSIRSRLRDAGGTAEVLSAPGQGTTVRLTWSPPPPAGAVAVDPLAWGRRVAPPPRLVYLGFMLPQQLSSLALLCSTWQDLRWLGAAAVVFAALAIATAATARNVSRMRMRLRTAVTLAMAVTTLVAAGMLAVAPGTSNAFAYWVAGESSTLIGVLFLLRGPGFGLLALAADLAALVTGLLVTGGAVSGGGWVGILAAPALGAGGGIAFLAAFRSLSKSTERQLAEYRERLRHQARAAAMRRADSTALANARAVAGPVLAQVASGQPPSAALRTAAELAGATLRDELLAPGFLPAPLADRVRSARAAGAHITVNCARQENGSLTTAARHLLAAALAAAGSVADLTLHVHPPTEGQPALLILHARGRPRSGHAALRECARQCGARLSDLGGHELLVRLQAAPRGAGTGTAAPGPVRRTSPTTARRRLQPPPPAPGTSPR
jgi:signal transduction histidine kinase